MKYDLLERDGTWMPLKKATTLGMQDGWLHWEHDDCIGLARPGTWRVRPER